MNLRSGVGEQFAVQSLKRIENKFSLSEQFIFFMTHIGIEIGGTKIQIVAGDAAGFIKERHRLVADRVRGGRAFENKLRQFYPHSLPRITPYRSESDLEGQSITKPD